MDYNTLMHDALHEHSQQWKISFVSYKPQVTIKEKKSTKIKNKNISKELN